MMKPNAKLTILGISGLALTVALLVPAIGADNDSTAGDRSAMVRQGGRRGNHEPGSRWEKAAELQKTLTSEEKAKLFSRADSAHVRGPRGGHPGMERGMKGMGRGEDRPEGNMERRSRTPEDAPAHESRELDAMATALGLTTQQKSAVAALLTSQRTEAKNLMEELRTAGTDREAVHARMQALRTRHMAALAQILNPTQMEIVKIHNAMGGHHGRGHGKGRGPRPEGQTNPGATAPGNGTNPALD